MACYTGPPLAPKLDGVGLIDKRSSTAETSQIVKIHQFSKIGVTVFTLSYD